MYPRNHTKRNMYFEMTDSGNGYHDHSKTVILRFRCIFSFVVFVTYLDPPIPPPNCAFTTSPPPHLSTPTPHSAPLSHIPTHFPAT